VASPLPQTTAKPHLQRERLPQTAPAYSFAVAGAALLDDADAEEEFDPFAVVDSGEWRIETRCRKRQDGAMVMYWNYRKRRITRTDDGRQRVAYRKGGSRTL